MRRVRLVALAIAAAMLLVSGGCGSTAPSGTAVPAKEPKTTVAAVPPDITGSWRVASDVYYGIVFNNGIWRLVKLSDEGVYENDDTYGTYEISDKPAKSGNYVITFMSDSERDNSQRCLTNNQGKCDEKRPRVVNYDEPDECIENCDALEYPTRLYINQYEIKVESKKNADSSITKFEFLPVLTERDKEQIQSPQPQYSYDSDHPTHAYLTECVWTSGFDYGVTSDSGDCVIDTSTWKWREPDNATLVRM